MLSPDNQHYVIPENLPVAPDVSGIRDLNNSISLIKWSD